MSPQELNLFVAAAANALYETLRHSWGRSEDGAEMSICQNIHIGQLPEEGNCPMNFNLNIFFMPLLS